MGSVRPLDENFLKMMLRRNFKTWITLEEHGLIGGFGSTILEWLSEREEIRSVRLKRIGVKDEFLHELGNQEYTRKKLKIDSNGIKNLIKIYENYWLRL